MIYYYVDDLLAFFESHVRVSGIQRVTIAILEEFMARASAGEGGQSVMLLAFDPAQRQLVAAPGDFFLQRNRSEDDLRAYFGLATPFVGPRKRKTIGARLTRLWIRLRGRVKARRLYANSIPWSQARFTSADVIYLSGAAWSHAASFDRLCDTSREHGARLAQMIFDILPVSRPDFFDEKLARRFHAWLHRVHTVADLVLTCSEATRRDLVQFATDAKGTPFRKLAVIPLAHEFLSHGPIVAPMRPHILQAMAAPYALVVGTVEIRKNHLALAKVWAELVETQGASAPRLVIAGRKGWLNDGFYELMAQTDHLGGAISLVEDATDDELASLYEQCLFSIYPSLAEGWGLPVGESLWFGRPVVTSSLSSMPEVAGDLVDYADPRDHAALLAAVARMLDAAYREDRARALAAFPLRRWADVAADIWTALTRLAADRPAS